MLGIHVLWLAITYGKDVKKEDKENRHDFCRVISWLSFVAIGAAGLKSNIFYNNNYNRKSVHTYTTLYS